MKKPRTEALETPEHLVSVTRTDATYAITIGFKAQSILIEMSDTTGEVTFFATGKKDVALLRGALLLGSNLSYDMG